MAPLQHRDPAVAEAILAVLRPAYAQESRLLGLTDFPPLRRSAADVVASDDFHLGAWVGNALAGVLSLGRDDEPDQLCIGMLVVLPSHQRRGLARALLDDLLQRTDGLALSVATGAANAPALALYASAGFVAYRHGVVGDAQVPLVKLRRPALSAVAPAAPVGVARPRG